ncbi:uncharacterized protein LOC121405505 isoform X1 [Drosophila obscura]|uniref:uncharacterized protein LOC121405505 isoform X1 n=1 Tax=Drosophila obscura TaxID=7282 RepID=UPI001BB27C90|nr:uncharacterized protein LOC121405505 isoform X1 [Drosophila obscura]XP_041452182.1 uncharacterized protein LOC121405505 isoform X1 [Drosophila obscura]XP_041452183.1 uncharacterized protein LOC121405505 isoform X1 [Drosophila obscura]
MWSGCSCSRTSGGSRASGAAAPAPISRTTAATPPATTLRGRCTAQQEAARPLLRVAEGGAAAGVRQRQRVAGGQLQQLQQQLDGGLDCEAEKKLKVINEEKLRLVRVSRLSSNGAPGQVDAEESSAACVAATGGAAGSGAVAAAQAVASVAPAAAWNY